MRSPVNFSTHASAHACKLGQRAGGVGAARDLEKLEALGVTHVVNASPIVPCFHRKRLRYRSICVYDDEQDDIAQHFAAATAFIAKVCIGASRRCLHMHGRCASFASSHRGRGYAGVPEKLKADVTEAFNSISDLRPLPAWCITGAQARRRARALLCGAEQVQHACDGVPH